MKGSDFFKKNQIINMHHLFLMMYFQPVIINKWFEFRRNFFINKPHFSGESFGLLFFFFLHLYFNEVKNEQITKGFKKLVPQVNFEKLYFSDFIRITIQLLWLIIIKTDVAHINYKAKKNLITNTFIFLSKLLSIPFSYTTTIFKKILNNIEDTDVSVNADFKPNIYLLIISLLAIICLTIPFNISAQLIFVFIMWFLAISIRKIRGYLPKLILVVLSLTLSSRYLFWRLTSTINTDSTVDTFFSIILICAETYTWIILLLGYFQIAGPLQRKAHIISETPNLWPSVDIFIPTYNEGIEIVKTTAMAALNIDWPKDKLNVYILDDGNRNALHKFASDLNIGYISRTDNIHAKAGNINNALTKSNGEYVAIFDCDHIPVRSFLQTTMGWFEKDKKLALIQTPHHFYSPDPFERNLNTFKKTPNENNLFYGVVQDGNDLWNAAFFCGSCAILKRSPLLEVGGIAYETVTEDAHTALKIHRKGYTSAYINIIQASGQATESLSAHIGQRIRWSRGMAQIFRIDNPLFGEGLNLSQRLCYANAMLHFFGGIPRLIFLIAPLAYLIIHAFIIHAPPAEIVLYAIPAIVHSNLANSYMHGKHRYSFWSEIYEAVLAWYIAIPTTIALFKPKLGSFNVTSKGGLINDEFFDLTVSKPYIVLIILNIIGISFGIYRMIWGPNDEVYTVILNILWALYNLLVLGGAISVAQETKQTRLHHRIEVNTDVIIRKKSGHLFQAKMNNYSNSGLGIEFERSNIGFDKNEHIHVILSRGQREFIFPIQIANINGKYIGGVFDHLTYKQISDFIKCNYSRSDAWITWEDNFSIDKPLNSFVEIINVGLKGYIVLARSLPKKFTKHFYKVNKCIRTIKTFFPKNIHDDSIWQ